MSDSSDPNGGRLPGKVYAWVSEFFYFMSWSMTALGPEPEEFSAAEEMLNTLDPRPDDMTAPAGAAAAERDAIDKAFESLVDQLAAHGFNPDLGNAPAKAAAIRQAVTQTAAKVVERAGAADGLRARLAQIRPPDGCLPAEAKAISDRATALTGALNPPHEDKVLADTAARADTLDADRAKLAEAVTARAERALKLTQDLDGVALSDEANTAESEEIAKAVAAAKLLITLPHDPAKLDEADKATSAISARIAAIKTAITEREAARKALRDRLDALKFAAGATPRELAGFAKRRIKCLAAIAKANDDEALAAVTATVEGIEKDVAENAAFAKARDEGLAAIDAAKALLKAEAGAIEQSFQAAMTGAISAAVAALGKATKPADIDALRATLAQVTGKLAAAKAHAAHRQDWLIKTALYVQTNPAAATARDTAIAAAEAKAKTGDYAGATSALDGFATAAGVSKDVLDAAEAYRVRLLAFQSANDALLAAIAKSKIPGGDDVKLQADAARAKAGGGDYAGAITALDAAEANIAALFACVDLWRKLNTLITKNTPANDPIRKAVTDAEAEMVAGKYGDALSALNGAPGESKDLAAAKARLQRLSGEAGTLGSGNNPHKTWVKAAMPASNALVATADFVDLNGKMDTAQGRIASVRAWMDADAPVRALQAQLDTDPPSLTFLDAADAKAAANDYPAAITKLNEAMTKLRKLADFRALDTQVERLVAVQTAGSDGHKTANDALTQARAKMNTEGKPDEAIAVLETLLENPGQSALAAIDTDWRKRLAATAARQKRVIALLSGAAVPEPAAALTAKFDAAQAKGETDHAIEEAIALLETHDATLARAQPMAALRRQVVKLQAAMERAEDAFPGNQSKIYAGKSKADIATDLAAADAEARKLNFAGAGAGYKALIEACKAFAVKTASIYEQADAKGTNAGHSLDRHGPNVTDEELLIRLQTGQAPDGKTSFCSASSRFDDPVAWLAAREIALEEATARGIDLSKTDYSASAITEADLKHETEIDHGEAIDRAFRGEKKNTGLRPDGTLGELQSYETFTELKGITKSKSLVLFVIDPPPDDPDPSRPKTLKAFKERLKKVNDAHKAHNDANPPPAPQKPIHPDRMTGRWVVMQHFPVVEGWDQETGSYV
ncbi:hypothetical protein [Defluviimonas sp. WL0075]|uniref:Uncharacterized protein n=1 Tax=Albidovulum sediminicola TaxID=2984331 RepID=A0ABT2YXJ5_9RHOB|nr:hypothetical protein [Defluviimonas sp. WL0075]MCV2863545.1 hypothetical protein [Defluviimonas sp. WL0075]